MSFCSEINQTLNLAREANRVADAHTGSMVNIIKGRLRKAHQASLSRGMGDDLAALKKELSKFDSRTKTWKD